jgi:Flp pilus assembly protein TadB
MTFINLLENYSSMEDELIAIFSRIQPFLTEPVRSAVEQCCIEAEMTGDKGRAIRNLEKRIEHEKFKELIRNLEICSRYEANYAEVIKDSRSLLREYLAAAKERKAILNNARIEIAMIIGCCGIVFWMMNDFTQAGIISILLGNLAGNVILAYCILMLLFAVWTVAIDRH